ncbi:MAG: hypothetical protein WAM59_06365 [Candidatus Acidiferrales bacterium]
MKMSFLCERKVRLAWLTEALGKRSNLFAIDVKDRCSLEIRAKMCDVCPGPHTVVEFRSRRISSPRNVPERNAKYKIGYAKSNYKCDWMVAIGGFAFVRIRPLRRRRILGIHVDFSNFHLPWTQMVELVESAKSNSTRCLALGGLPPGLARNGCARLLGRKQARHATPIAKLVLGTR